MAKIVELIYSNEKCIGAGTEADPKRTIEEWFEKDGTLVFEKDPWKPPPKKERKIEAIFLVKEIRAIIKDTHIDGPTKIERIEIALAAGSQLFKVP